jgi:hypothetical protein
MVGVRRLLCTACGRTVNVPLPDLIPRRWCSAAAILMLVIGHLLLATRASTLAKLYGPSVLAESWRLPSRLAAQLGIMLWARRAREVGDGPDLPHEALLSRLLGLAGTHARAPAEELHAAARMLTADPASQSRRAR